MPTDPRLPPTTYRLPPPQAGVPRRFSVGELMLVVSFFAVLFAVMRSLDFHPAVFAVVGLFFVVVAVGQAVLFGGKDPRRASVRVGAVLAAIAIVLLSLFPFAMRLLGRFPSFIELLVWFVTFTAALAAGVPLGGLAGYLAGALLAGVFLILRMVRPPREGE
jgi:hypothetical protein